MKAILRVVREIYPLRKREISILVSLPSPNPHLFHCSSCAASASSLAVAAEGEQCADLLIKSPPNYSWIRHRFGHHFPMISFLIIAAATTQTLTTQQLTTEPTHGYLPASLMDWAAIVNCLVVFFMFLAWLQTRHQIKSAQVDSKNKDDQMNRRLDLMAAQAITGPFFEMLAMLQSIVESTKVKQNHVFYEG